MIVLCVIGLVWLIAPNVLYWVRSKVAQAIVGTTVSRYNAPTTLRTSSMEPVDIIINARMPFSKLMPDPRAIKALKKRSETANDLALHKQWHIRVPAAYIKLINGRDGDISGVDLGLWRSDFAPLGQSSQNDSDARRSRGDDTITIKIGNYYYNSLVQQQLRLFEATALISRKACTTKKIQSHKLMGRFLASKSQSCSDNEDFMEQVWVRNGPNDSLLFVVTCGSGGIQSEEYIKRVKSKPHPVTGGGYGPGQKCTLTGFYENWRIALLVSQKQPELWEENLERARRFLKDHTIRIELDNIR